MLTYVRFTQKQCNMDMLDVLKVAAAKHYAHLAAALHCTLKELDPQINDRPPEKLARTIKMQYPARIATRFTSIGRRQ
jgi:hypothetical protein